MRHDSPLIAGEGTILTVSFKMPPIFSFPSLHPDSSEICIFLFLSRLSVLCRRSSAFYYEILSICFFPPQKKAVVKKRQPEQLPAQRFQPPEHPRRLARALIAGRPSQRERGAPAPVSAPAKSAIAGLPCRRNHPEKAGPL